MEDLEYESIIQWCCRQHYYNDMLSYTKQALDTNPTNDRFRVYLAFAFTLTSQSKDAFKLSSQLMESDDTALVALHIQSLIHRKCNSDRMTIAQNDIKIRDERRKASPYALSLAAMILVLLGQYSKAKEYSDRAYKLNPEDQYIVLARCWSYLIHDNISDNSYNYFELVLKESTRNFNALLGSAKYKEIRGDHKGAISILNSLIVRYPKLSLPLIEKLNNLLALKDWDQVFETINRILTFESSNLDALKIKATIVICKDGDYQEGVKHVQAFFRNLILAEGKNVELFSENIELFSRISVGNQIILAELFKNTDKMAQVNIGDATIMVLLGNVCFMLQKYKDAEHWYRSAIKVEESNYKALLGLTRCQLMENSTTSNDFAKEQINFLYDMQSDNITAELMFVSASQFHNEPTKVIECLENAVAILLRDCQQLPYGCEYLRRLDPNLCLEIVNKYLTYSPESQDKNCELSINDGGSICIEILERVIEACPGMSNALLLLGQVKSQVGDFEGAISTLKKLLDSVDQTSVAGHLLMARILIQQGEFELASQALEIGLSYNFKVRDDPLYYMILGIVAKEKDDLEEAIKNFQTAMTFSKSTDNGENNSKTSTVSVSDKTTLYLELISVYCILKKYDEAMKLMEDIKEQIRGTAEENRLIIGNAELCLKMEDVDKAIENLKQILPGQLYYLQAHTKLAEIYLHKRKDRFSFAKCFRDLVEYCPGPKTYSMLGDAYLAIQEPEMAIEAYEMSLKDSPGDKSLARKMGVALVKTHQYVKALNYYNQIIKREDCKELKLDMAELYMKLKQFDKAETVLLEELEKGKNVNDLQGLEMRQKQLLLLAKVREKAGNIKNALAALNEAKENQIRYMQRAIISSSASHQKNVLVDILISMAEHSTYIRNYPQAVSYYKEVLSYKPNYIKALLSLSKLYMQMNELDNCTHYCKILLTAEPNNEAACVMMADLAFRKVDFETAAYHFRQLLLQKPTYWTALARLIEVSRRTGNMDDLHDWLLRAKKSMESSKLEAGYYYCSGLLDWRTGKLSSALQNFNAARRDPEWGQQAIYNMIEICLNDDENSTLTTEIFSEEDVNYNDDSKSGALKTAKKLLLELNPKGNPQEMLTHRLLKNFYLLATKQKINIDLALNDCTALASQEIFRDHVGTALGLATAHVLLKQTPRARNHLKRVSKNTWTFEDAEYLERCWLLLAEIYAQNSKSELSIELLKRIIQHNATCVRAYEIFGQISIKEQNYKEASSMLSYAWKYGGKSKLSIGYKLSYCYLKTKSYADSIEICNEVLKIDPDYPRIRREILDKAIINLRT